ncbi:MAG: LysR family transcriptional regulator [Myxococcota bacterium]
MDLERLRVLVAVEEAGSLSRAAKALGYSSKLVRRRIDELEAQVGVPLLEVHERALVWTPAAELIVREGKDLLRLSEALLRRMRGGAPDELAGEYRLATLSGAHAGMLAAVTRQALLRFPRLRLTIAPSPDPMALLPDQADIAYYLGPRPTHGPWLSTVLLRAEERVFASADYLARHGPIECLDDLHEHRLLSWEPLGGDADRWPLRDGGSFFVYSSLISPDVAMLRRTMLRGGGIARLPDAHLPEQGDEVPILPDVLGRELCLTVAMPDTPKMRSLFLLFSNFARTWFHEYRR